MKRRLICLGITFCVLMSFLIFSFYSRLSDMKVTIDATDVVQSSAPAPIKDPCTELRTERETYRKTVLHLKQQHYLLLADLALEVELSGMQSIPAYKLVQLLRQYDTTENKIYNKLYSHIEATKKGK